MTERAKTLAALFAAAKGVEAFAVTDIVQRMWEKLVHLSTAAAMTCLMRANVGEIVRPPYGLSPRCLDRRIRRTRCLPCRKYCRGNRCSTDALCACNGRKSTRSFPA